MKSKNKNIKASIIASSMSGVLEIGFFHPLDTVAKRLMNNNSFVVHFEDIRWKDGGNVMFKNKKFIHKRSSNLI